MLGASTDNNIICTDEKEVLVVSSVADELMRAMAASGAVVVNASQLPQLEKAIFTEQRGPRRPGVINRDLIGKNAGVILGRIGMNVPDSVRLGDRRGGRGPPAAVDRADDARHAGLPRPERR